MVVYVDLDSVVLGPLDELAAFDTTAMLVGPAKNIPSSLFGTLGTEGMVNERRAGGINSSVMCWRAGDFERLWTDLISHFWAVRQVTYKLDAWLEMMLLPPPPLPPSSPASSSSSLAPSGGGDDDGGGGSAASPPPTVQRFTGGAVVRLQEVFPGQVREYCDVRDSIYAADAATVAAATATTAEAAPSIKANAVLLAADARPAPSQGQLSAAPPRGTRLVTFPLHPKPHEVKDEWVQRAWVL
jgi:hypothetical protein